MSSCEQHSSPLHVVRTSVGGLLQWKAPLSPYPPSPRGPHQWRAKATAGGACRAQVEYSEQRRRSLQVIRHRLPAKHDSCREQECPPDTMTDISTCCLNLRERGPVCRPAMPQLRKTMREFRVMSEFKGTWASMSSRDSPDAKNHEGISNDDVASPCSLGHILSCVP